MGFLSRVRMFDFIPGALIGPGGTAPKSAVLTHPRPGGQDARRPLVRHGGRTLAGLVSRVARRLLALAAAILHNWSIGEPGRSLVAYDH